MLFAAFVPQCKLLLLALHVSSCCAPSKPKENVLLTCLCAALYKKNDTLAHEQKK